MNRLSTLIILFLVSCGAPAEEPRGSAPKTSTELTAFELEHGVGPITTNPDLPPIDAEKVAKGKAIYDMKCVSCHVFGERFVGPDLSDVTERRSAAYIQNMILNPSGMIRRHPEAKKLLAEYMTPMPYQNVTEDDARALLDYLRSIAP